MKEWLTLLNKEFLEMARNYKLVWIPMVFILIGLLDPITTYFLPQILKSAGGLPEGAVIEIPTPSAEEVFIMSMGEYQTLGVLIVALSLMGTIAGETKSGVAQLILVKPVSYFSYITSKWVGGLLLFIFSLLIGSISSWYYTGVLFEFIPFTDYISSFSIFGLWYIFVITTVVFFSAVMKQPGGAAVASLGAIFIINMLGNAFSHLVEWSPTQLSSYSTQILLTGTVSEHLVPASVLTILVIMVTLYSAVVILKRREIAD